MAHVQPRILDVQLGHLPQPVVGLSVLASMEALLHVVKGPAQLLGLLLFAGRGLLDRLLERSSVGYRSLDTLCHAVDLVPLVIRHVGPWSDGQVKVGISQVDRFHDVLGLVFVLDQDMQDVHFAHKRDQGWRGTTSKVNIMITT